MRTLLGLAVGVSGESLAPAVRCRSLTLAAQKQTVSRRVTNTIRENES